METIKFWDIPTRIKELTFDGDNSDLRLHGDSPFWGAETKEEYEAVEERINAFEVEGKAWTAYAWCDISGYEYWHVTMEEDNYCQLTFRFDSEDVDVSELDKIHAAIDAFDSEFSDLTPVH